MLDKRDLEDDILGFVSIHSGKPKRALSAKTCLGVDLGFDGDDADDFMADFAREFEVDLSNFIFSNHFTIETGFNPFSFLISLTTRKAAPEVNDVSIDDLINAASQKKWPKSEDQS